MAREQKYEDVQRRSDFLRSLGCRAGFQPPSAKAKAAWNPFGDPRCCMQGLLAIIGAFDVVLLLGPPGAGKTPFGGFRHPRTRHHRVKCCGHCYVIRIDGLSRCDSGGAARR